MSFGHELRDVTRQLEAQGWRHEDTSKGHHKFLPPDPKAPIVVCSGTPSDHRAWDNFMSQLKRSGAHISRNRRHAGSVPSQVLHIMLEQPTKTFNTEELCLILSARNPEKLKAKTSLRNLVGIACCDLYKRGDVKRVGQGTYRIEAPPAPKPEPVVVVAAPVPVLPPPVLREDDMKQLTAALYDSLGVIEKIVIKYNRLHEEHEQLKTKSQDLRAIVREEIAAASAT